MLVLSRKTSEVIHIGPEVSIMVVRIGPNSVRLGISAPKHLQITRSEPQASNQKEQSVEKVS